MSTASVLTFIEQLNSGKMNTDRAKVYNAIKRTPGCNLQRICSELELSKIVVGARLSELRKLGVVYISKVRTESKTHFSEYMVEERLEFITSRARNVKSEHFLKWLKKGQDYAEFLDSTTNDVIEYMIEKERNSAPFAAWK